MGGLEYIRKAYGVPAFRDGVIEFQGKQYFIRRGEDGHLICAHVLTNKKIRLHPTWEVKYLFQSDDRELWWGLPVEKGR